MYEGSKLQDDKLTLQMSNMDFYITSQQNKAAKMLIVDLLLSIEWNSIRLAGPAQGIWVTLLRKLGQVV